MDINEAVRDLSVFFIVGIMIFLLGLYIILISSVIETLIIYIPIGIGTFFILSSLFLVIWKKLDIK